MYAAFQKGARDKDDRRINADVRKALIYSARRSSVRRMRRDAHLELKEKGIGRNASCPCSSGKKFKHCHLNLIDSVKDDVDLLVKLLNEIGVE